MLILHYLLSSLRSATGLERQRRRRSMMMKIGDSLFSDSNARNVSDIISTFARGRAHSFNFSSPFHHRKIPRLGLHSRVTEWELCERRIKKYSIVVISSNRFEMWKSKKRNKSKIFCVHLQTQRQRGEKSETISSSVWRDNSNNQQRREKRCESKQVVLTSFHKRLQYIHIFVLVRSNLWSHLSNNDRKFRLFYNSIVLLLKGYFLKEGRCCKFCLERK